MWDLRGPGFEPVSPALAGRFLATAPPGKPELTNKYLKTEIVKRPLSKTLDEDNLIIEVQ